MSGGGLPRMGGGGLSREIDEKSKEVLEVVSRRFSLEATKRTKSAKA